MTNKNTTIDMFRLIAAILVVTIHCNPFEGGNKEVNLFFQISTRIAVPFFAIVGGYFCEMKSKENPLYYQKYIKNLIKVYSIISVPYVMFFVVVNKDTIFSYKELVLEIIINFLYKGTYFHLWFYPSIIISIVVIQFFKKYCKEKWLIIFSVVLYIAFVMGDSYYGTISVSEQWNKIVNSNIYTYIRPTVLAFTYAVLGTKIARLSLWWMTNNTNTKIEKRLGIFLLLLYIEGYLTVHLGISRSVSFTFFLYPTVMYIFLFALKHSTLVKKHTYFKQLASYIYFFHPIILTLFSIISNNSMFIWGGTLVTLISTGVFLIRRNNKYINFILK